MEKTTIRFRVSGQNLTMVGNHHRFASNSVGLVRIEIDPEDEWIQFDSVDAVFQNDQDKTTMTMFYEGASYACAVPADMLSRMAKVYVNLSGKNIVDGELVERLTTYPVLAFIIDETSNVSNYRDSVVPANQYEQFIEAVGRQASKLADVEVTAHQSEEPEVIKTYTPNYPLSLDFGLVKGDKGDQGDQGIQGIQGETGDAAGFGTVSATVDANHGTPAVTVTASGDDTAKNFAFAFSNLQPAPYDDSVIQARMDTFTNLAAGSTTGDAELADGRVGADGVTYTNIGGAIRGQVTALKSKLSEEQLGKIFMDINWARGSLTSGGNYSSSTSNRVATVDKVTAPSDICITVKSGFRYYLYTFVENAVDKKTGWLTNPLYLPKGTIFTVVIARVTEVSETADVATFASKISFGDTNSGRITNLDEYMSAAFNAVNAISVSAEDAIKNTNYYIKNTGVITSTTSSYGVSDRLLCRAGDTISFKLSSGSGYLIFAVFNNEGTMTHYETASGNSNYITATYTFVEGDAYYYLSGVPNRVGNYAIQYGTVPSMITDLDSRVTALEDNSENLLPAYWQTYLNTLYPTLYAKDALIGNNGDSFVFITDVHYERNELKSPALIQNIVKNTAVKKVFNGGDTLDEGDTVAVALEKLSNWQSMMDGLRNFNIVGNHDSNNYDSSNPDNALTIGQYYGIMVKPAEQWINTDGNIYFCVDNDSQKVRYICLAIEAFANVEEGSPQRTWLQSKLTEKDSSWTIIVLQHRIWGSNTDTIADRAQNVINAINAVYSNIHATFIGIIAGHTHLDYYTTESVNGYLLIACNCDTLSGTNSGYTRTAGTTSEQSFDIFHIDKTNRKLYATRVGAGSDRDWSY